MPKNHSDWIAKPAPSVDIAIYFLHLDGFIDVATLPVPRILSIYDRVNRKQLIYDRCSTEELQKFCFDRRLIKPKSALVRTTSSRRLQPALIILLEKADADAQFRLTDLPPELREWIYELYMAKVDPAELALSSTPPLLRASRLVRQESLPIWRACCKL